jgi:hypothetical protein
MLNSVVCVIGAVLWELTEITVEVKCHFVLMMREDFESDINLGMYRVMKVDWMTGNKEKYRSGGFEMHGK